MTLPIIEPAAIGQPDKLATSFARLGDDEGVFPGILSHVPNYAEAMWDAMAEALFEGGVDHRL